MCEITEVINIFSKKENCIIGICDASPLPQTAMGFTPFVSRNMLKRTDPAKSLPGVKSIIVIGVENKFKTFPPMPDDAGILSVLGVTDDYHVTARALLNKLVTELKQLTSFTHKILVDSSALDERAIAVRAGLGFIGRSGLLISSAYGSRLNIGLLLTDIPLNNANPQYTGDTALCSSAQQNLSCAPNCHKCISSCPNGALSNTGKLTTARCISYLTQKEDLTSDEAKLIGRHLYGCDICQNVCPFNSPQPTAWANPKDWLAMSNEDFSNTYGHTAMLWRGADLLRRNAKIVIENLT